MARQPAWAGKQEWNRKDYADARSAFCKHHGITEKQFNAAPDYLLGDRERQYVETDGNEGMAPQPLAIITAIITVCLACAGLIIPAVICGLISGYCRFNDK